MKKNRLFPLRAKIIAITICVVITIIYGIVALLPAIKCKEYRSKISIERRQITRLENDENNYRKLIRKYKREKKELEEILFTDRDVSSFLEEISLIARKSGIKISEMKTRRFKKVKPKNSTQGNSSTSRSKKASGNTEDQTLSLAAIPIDMKIVGKFSPIVNFLTFLEGYRQLVTLSNVVIRVKKYPLLRCEFILRLYSLKSARELKERR